MQQSHFLISSSAVRSDVYESDVYGNCLNVKYSVFITVVENSRVFPLIGNSTSSLALNFFCVLETNLPCSKTVQSTMNHCLLPY